MYSVQGMCGLFQGKLNLYNYRCWQILLYFVRLFILSVKPIWTLVFRRRYCSLFTWNFFYRYYDSDKITCYNTLQCFLELKPTSNRCIARQPFPILCINCNCNKFGSSDEFFFVELHSNNKVYMSL